MSTISPQQLEALIPFAATENQAEMLQGIVDHGSVAAYANYKGIATTNLYSTIRKLKACAAKKGHAPEHDMHHTVPDGFKVKGTSTLYDRDGEVKIQWVKTNEDRDRAVEIMREVVETITEDVDPLPPFPPPQAVEDDLLNVYTMTDCHIGMLAWGRETGKDWDLGVAERTLTSCFADMVRRSPKASECVIAQLGDWLHYDGLQAITPTSGHVLDADSRAGKMVGVACRVLERLVDMALAKHSKVRLLIAEGNHDLYGSLFLRTMFRRLYRDEPRVEIIESENPYYAARWGVNMLAWHHGHKKGPGQSIVQTISQLYREMWGATDHCFLHMGDKHHKDVKEYAGCTVEQHGTLAANDAYAVRGGWNSQQYAEAITYSAKLGECGRVRTNPAMVGM